MADIVVTDPLGRKITLHDHTWYGHIISGHPEMRRHRSLLRQAIEKPIAIHISDADSDCRLYFGEGPRATIMVVVVAKLKGGFVKTAHFVKAVKGALEWSRPTP
jgi:hypothetical protein